MSIEQEQRTVNSLDKDIADLEKKKATADKKAAAESRAVASVTINKNASPSVVKSKLKEIERHKEAARKLSQESANLQEKIAEKRTKRNAAYLKLQKEEQADRKKQERVFIDMRRAYERRISELELNQIKTIKESVNAFVYEFPRDSEYDVFVSHAWEDKESFVDEFVQCLCDRKIKVWYDKTQIKWGDSMRARIDAGLQKSKFGVVVLSPDYISEGKYWTKAELDGLFQLESVGGKMLLPIWHNLTKKQVMDFSPTLACKLAMTTAAMTADEIADELLKLLVTEEEN
ncbi:toll/interleukin-1 receptor domain-containing protein [Dialister invisus]|uniref:toll/interleukin-1 receptor domain-containing protein n=1 Tax=Dialister invisus TaxID=218538 RepID=UPI0028D453CF|nr:toll/interleukin-1 receptor domain-containing protein [Dialister invisus]